jgi:hypothetical protein
LISASYPPHPDDPDDPETLHLNVGLTDHDQASTKIKCPFIHSPISVRLLPSVTLMPNGSPPTLEWTTIPPELWHCAITYASNADQRAFLAVSRFFRAAAHRVIFRVVYLQFGVWESIRPDDESDEEDTEDFAVSTARRTRELTERIAHDAAFAQAVQSLHVLAYTMQQGLDPEGHAATLF